MSSPKQSCDRWTTQPVNNRQVSLVAYKPIWSVRDDRPPTSLNA